MNFYYLLNSPELFIVYVNTSHAKNVQCAITKFLENRKTNKTLHLIYTTHNNEAIENGYEDVYLYRCEFNFEPTILQLNFSKSTLRLTGEQQISFWKNYDCLILESSCVNKFKNKSLLENTIQKLKKTLFSSFQHNLPPAIEVEKLVLYLYENFPQLASFNLTEFFNTYKILSMQNWFAELTTYETHVFENVYYRNKGFYCQDGEFCDISQIKSDLEYKDYNKTSLKIDTKNPISVNDSVLFLDYIYDFYNFGEFWDVLQRIIAADIKENVKCFGLSRHRISNINEYFNKCNLEYPPTYVRDYTWKDVNEETNQGSTFFFKKVYLSTIKNTCRGSLNPWTAFKMNQMFNVAPTVSKEFKLYLSRGKEKRGMENEERLITALQSEGFVVLNGSEPIEEQMFYFTNASLIIGVHSSLMKNIVWCKKNPIFVELFPPSRSHLCFIGNAEQLGYIAIPLLCNANKQEEIIMTDQNIYDIIKLIKYLYS